MTHLSPDGGASPPSAILSRQMLDLQIVRRRARLAELETEMIAACEAAALGTRSRTNASCRARALGPGDLASLSRRRHAAGGDLRPAHAPPSPGNRPARTADDIADRSLTGCQDPLPCPAAAGDVGIGGERPRIGQVRRPTSHLGRQSRQGSPCSPPAHRRGSARSWSIRSPVRSLAAIRCAADRADPRRSTTAPGHRAADLRACVPPLPSTTASPAGSPITPPTVGVERGTAKAARFGVGGMTPGGQPAHRCG